MLCIERQLPLMNNRTSINFLGKSVLVQVEEERMLVIGDLHLGYERNVQRMGVSVDTLAPLLAELQALCERAGNVSVCVLLGDVIHHFTPPESLEWQGVTRVLTLLGSYSQRIVIIRGNHDNALAPLVRSFPLTLIDSFTWKGYCCVHGNKDVPALHEREVHTWLIGHGHPAYRLCQGAKQALYKCILTGTYRKKKIFLLPSFFEGIVGSDIHLYILPYPWPFHLARFIVHIVGEDGITRTFGLVGSS
jgi:putative SbcD/Mre11-related phosphoesterase